MLALCKHTGAMRAARAALAPVRTLCELATPEMATPEMNFSTTESIPGKTIKQYVGFAEGSTVRSKNVGHDVLASFKSIVGGELTSYTDLLREARAEAMARLAQDASSKGANAVVGLRLVSSSVSAGASEILAYGTAVRVE